MDPRIVAHLRCPVCRGPLAPAARSLRCGAGHSFDLARQGHVDLTGGRVTHEGDTAAMIAARADVLRSHHFDFVTRVLADTARAYRSGLVVDVGAGTGHHLAAVLEARPADVGIAFDVSKAALRRAARAHPRLAAVRADAWRGLPLPDDAAALLLNVFAPRDGREFARVLAPGGRLLVVTPAPGHLRELDLPVRVDPAKEERVAGALEPWLVRENVSHLRATMDLAAEHARALAVMGPSAHHARTPGPAGSGAGCRVTAAVHLTVWRHGEG